MKGLPRYETPELVNALRECNKAIRHALSKEAEHWPSVLLGRVGNLLVAIEEVAQSVDDRGFREFTEEHPPPDGPVGV